MSLSGLCVFTIWVSILVSIVKYSCNHHRLLMTAWVSHVCLAKNMVVWVLISYVVQWGRSTDIQFEVKFISSCFYISYFMDFTSTCIWAPGKLPLTFLPINIWIMLIQVQIPNYHLFISLSWWQRGAGPFCVIQFLHKLRYTQLYIMPCWECHPHWLHNMDLPVYKLPGYYFPWQLCWWSLW